MMAQTYQNDKARIFKRTHYRTLRGNISENRFGEPMDFWAALMLAPCGMRIAHG